jgi:hypothetical protein
VRFHHAAERERFIYQLLVCETGTIIFRNPAEKELFIDNLLVRIHLIIETMLGDRPCAMGV